MSLFLEINMLFDLSLRYAGEDIIRPYVVNCGISQVGEYTTRVSNLACVAQIFIDIHPSSPTCEFFEFTL